jgi:hypothetical protein
MLAVSMPKSLTALLVGRDGDEVARQISFRGRLQEPVARRARVEHGLGRGKGFRGDDEQRGFRIHLRQCGVHVVAVDVGDEVHLQARVA